jgi:hypothetical protein
MAAQGSHFFYPVRLRPEQPAGRDRAFLLRHAVDAPLVLVVLAAFAAGLAIGALGMVPRWWKHRARARLPASAARRPMPAP